MPMRFEKIALAEMRPAEYNPRKQLTPDDLEWEQIRKSIEEFGYADPIVVNRDLTIIKGHQRRNVMMALGYTEAECVVLDVDKKKEKALNIALNKITGKWDVQLLTEVIGEIDLSGVDATVTGFTEAQIEGMTKSVGDWFESRKRDDKDKQGGNEEYNEFLEKFEPKKTTDDCYTPDIVYEAIASWVAERYKKNKEDFVRPFFPGGDYQAMAYAPGSVVVDNPPFSILSEIIRFYTEKEISFFLFAPAVSLISAGDKKKATGIATGCSITYENGASVCTSFVTNLEDPMIVIKTEPELYKRAQAAADEYLKSMRKGLPKYHYPDNIVTSAILARWSKYGIDFAVKRSDAVSVDALDEQKAVGKAIFGKGLLLSERAAAERAAAERAAAERAAAERAAAERWSLSEREIQIVKSLGVDRSETGEQK